VINVAVIEVIARVVCGNVDVEPKALALDGRESGRGNSIAQSGVEDGGMHFGGEPRIEPVPEIPTLDAVILEAQPRVKVGRADGPQMVGVEDVVRNVFAGVSLGCNAFARLCPGPLLRYNGRFKDLPNPAFVQVHDPTVVVFASLASRLMNPHRPQSD